ncbi:sensor domain-containing diguanylate cyclase [Paucibacter sp. Y2R2-4]|uniref:sensor domain-containing diguanylate cyclase n=1 Tax=Paucibacter sp. Y2R2-4 TaxID=2893553 RepID=UPI0021E49AA8|nr:sensor domain-containing diguanylate cyclase [Paucibacter sp. Y2R2-4]MCV2349107.1 diguanylate cyclase [Paucibacter sp. Y2R2-4]
MEGGDSLVERLTRLNLLALSATLLATFALIAIASLLAARDLQAEAAEHSAELLANSLAPMLVFEDRGAAAQELASFALQSDERLMRVSNASKQVFAQWPPQGVSALALLPSQLATSGTLRTMHWREVEVWVPIRFKQELVGYLGMKEGLQRVQLAVLRMVALAAALIGLAIVLAGRLLRWVQRKALAPIVELSDLAEQVALNQDYSQRAKVHRFDEVGRLSERFNQMLKRVEISQAELNQQLRQEQQAGQQFELLAHRDSLTQLPNRLYFQSALQRHMAASCQEVHLMALMFIDLDNFKTVNDRHGHDAGDAVLLEVAQRMTQVLRAGDVLCRLGGDEFALILPNLPDEGSAEQLALRLIAAIREPMVIGGHWMPIGATVGLAFCPTDEVDAPQLLSAADVAMYAAKRAGKNTYRRVNRGGA